MVKLLFGDISIYIYIYIIIYIYENDISLSRYGRLYRLLRYDDNIAHHYTTHTQMQGTQVHTDVTYTGTWTQHTQM